MNRYTCCIAITLACFILILSLTSTDSLINKLSITSKTSKSTHHPYRVPLAPTTVMTFSEKSNVKYDTSLMTMPSILLKNGKKTTNSNSGNSGGVNLQHSSVYTLCFFVFIEFFGLNIANAAAISDINNVNTVVNVHSNVLVTLATSIGVHWKYFIAGAVGCTVSHGVTVPFDVIKTRIQVQTSNNNDRATADGNNGYLNTAKQIINDEGIATLFQGMSATLIGYAIHGTFKYGLYESFKPIILDTLSSSSPSIPNVVLISFILSGIFAEFIAASFLSPFEAARIRLVANPSYATDVVDTIKKISSTEGYMSLYQGLPALLTKHIPYTVTQLTSYEVITKTVYSMAKSNGFTVDQITSYRFVTTVTVALIAAVLSSLASQPGDTLLSIINKTAKITLVPTTTSASTVESFQPIRIMAASIKELGIAGLFKGTKARLIHVSFIVVIQLLVYDYLKLYLGLVPH